MILFIPHVCSGGLWGGDQEEEREAPALLRLPEVFMEREQQRREDLQAAAGEGHALLLGPDQGHDQGVWKKVWKSGEAQEVTTAHPLSHCVSARSPGEGLQPLHRHAERQSGR